MQTAGSSDGLSVTILNDGGAHLSVTSTVNEQPDPGVFALAPLAGGQGQPLMIKVIDNGGARLSVESSTTAKQ
jgi:hypothetical protein